jgi:hypothetical protein
VKLWNPEFKVHRPPTVGTRKLLVCICIRQNADSACSPEVWFIQPISVGRAIAPFKVGEYKNQLAMQILEDGAAIGLSEKVVAELSTPVQGPARFWLRTGPSFLTVLLMLIVVLGMPSICFRTISFPTLICIRSQSPGIPG